MPKRTALLAGAALALTAALTACGASSASSRADIGQPRTDDLPVVQTVVQGVPLLCVHDLASYDALSCNWEAWNKAKAGTK